MSRIVWFSCGAASAVVAKLATHQYGPSCQVVYCDMMATEHPDNERFFSDVEKWIGRTITVIRSSQFSDINDVFEKTRYMAGIRGARCTSEMKKSPREKFAHVDDIHLFGYTTDEAKRAQEFEDRNPSLFVEWFLIDRGISKEECLLELLLAGIKLPAMYGLGFDHNNCLGCVKATSPGYWNRIRRLFPAVFAQRCAQSRKLGVKLVRLKGVRIFLDDLPPDADAPDDAIECSPVCQSEQA